MKKQVLSQDSYANAQAVALTKEQIRLEQASFIAKVYGWMTIALIVTTLVAWLGAAYEPLPQFILSSRWILLGFAGAGVLLVRYLSVNINNLSAGKATFLFLLYAAKVGLMLSIVVYLFTTDSIAVTFAITAGTFGVMSAYGYYTKKDLTSIGNIALMALVGFLIASIVNIFFFNDIVYWVLTFLGIIIFVALVAYDTQKIKEANVIGNEGTEEDHKEAIMGALILYLDFINLFLLLLRLFGRRK